MKICIKLSVQITHITWSRVTTERTNNLQYNFSRVTDPVTQATERSSDLPYTKIIKSIYLYIYIFIYGLFIARDNIFFKGDGSSK